MSKFIENMDSNVNPETGNTLRKVFKYITLILVFLVMPVIVFTVGSFAVVAPVASWVVWAGFIPWIVLVVIFGSLWFYFSKWTEE